MGASARKINNARSQAAFANAQTSFGQANSIANKPYSDAELGDLRSRATSPITAAYGQDAEQMKRAALTSGGAPNLIASLAKNNRSKNTALSQGIGDANAGIAQMNLQGRLSGIGAEQGAVGQQNNVRPYEGFGWGKLAGLVGQGMGAAATAFGGGKG